MPTARPQRSDLVAKLAIALATALLYTLAYTVNETFDELAVYAQGVSLIFLPSGVRTVMILVGGRWAALGAGVALAFMAHGIWPEMSLPVLVGYAAVSSVTAWLAISTMLRLLKIPRDLSGLRFAHLPVIDLVTTLAHAFVVNSYFVLFGLRSPDHIADTALAMAFGDFVGTGVVMLVLMALLSVRRVFAAQASDNT